MSKEHASIEFEDLPVVKNDLLRREHVEYCTAWHKEIGDRNKVIYYKMGADISTVLLTTNATEIIGIDSSFHEGHTEDYIKKYWNFIDQKAIPVAGAFGYRNKSFTAENFVPSKDMAEMFKEDLERRKQRGYWNSRAEINFGTDRLFLIELKKLGVRREIINIKNQENLGVEITFNWAYPGERSKGRKVTFLSQHSVTETKRNVITLLKDSDCYYQKGLRPETTYALVQDVQPYLKEASVIAIGYQFKRIKDNYEYGKEIGLALGHWYKPQYLDVYFSDLIDKLPEEDPDYEDNKYGMKMHIFERKQYPVKKYKYNFHGAEESSL